MASDTSTNKPSSPQPVSDIVGLILSAGASSRMGRPKALLQYNDGSTLLSQQVELIRDSGMGTVGVVVGAGSDAIMNTHPKLDVRWIENRGWESGQFSSVQAGLKKIAKLTTTGVILLPVDVIGVKSTTVQAIIETALINPHTQVIIPEFEERGGHPIYLSHQFCDDIANIDPSSEDARLDMQIRKCNQVIRFPASDPAIIGNINTPKDWENVLDRIQ